MQSPTLYISQDATTKMATIGFKTDRPVTGKAQWYRPSDKSADFVVQLKDKETTVSTDKIVKGKWVLKVEWTIDGKTSYAEEQIFIN